MQVNINEIENSGELNLSPWVNKIAINTNTDKHSIGLTMKTKLENETNAEKNLWQAFKSYKCCNLTVIFVAEQFEVPVKKLMIKTRSIANEAQARQIAIYLAHTIFSVSYREVGLYFGRDRTTVAHACKTIEDLRDNTEFDCRLSKLEKLLSEAADFTRAMEFIMAANTDLFNAEGDAQDDWA